MSSITLVADEQFHSLILVSLELTIFFLLEIFNVFSMFLDFKIL